MQSFGSLECREFFTLKKKKKTCKRLTKTKTCSDNFQVSFFRKRNVGQHKRRQKREVNRNVEPMKGFAVTIMGCRSAVLLDTSAKLWKFVTTTKKGKLFGFVKKHANYLVLSMLSGVLCFFCAG